MKESNIILKVCDVNKFFKKRGSLKHALKNINFDVEEGDFYGIIGESGSGKTTLGRSIIRLNTISGGNIYLYDKLISSKKISKNEKKYICENIQMIFQDPMSSLNPKMNILKIISEPLQINKEIKNKVNEIIKKKEKINKIYKYKVLMDIEETSLNKTKEYFENYINIIDEKCVEIKEFRFSNEDDWISSFNEIDNLYNSYINKLKSNINDFSNIVDIQKKLIKSVYKLEDAPEKLKKYIDEGMHETDEEKKLRLDCEEASNKLNQMHDIKKSNEEKKIIKMIYKDFKIQEKFYKNKSKTENTKLSYYNDIITSLNFKSNSQIVKEILDINYINENELNKKINDCISKVNNYFKNINEMLFSSDLNKNEKENKIKKMLSSHAISEMINNISYEIISSLKKLNNENEKKFNIEYKKVENDLEKKIKNYKDFLIKKEDTIDLHEFSYIYEEYKNKYELRKEEFKKKREEISNLKDILKKKKSHLEKILKSHVLKLYKMRPSALSDFSKSEAKEIIKKNTKSFKTQIKTKNKTLESIDFEFKNILDVIFINKKLSSSSKIKLWFYKGELVNLLILNRVFALLESVGLKKEHAYRYPHEFSGGQRQRIVIARSLITNPKLIIADEAISALDVSVQAQVINILKELSEKKGMTFLFIAHDLSMVQHICNKVIIMHNGAIVEKGLVSKIFQNPVHPYTKSLFTAIPELSRMDVDLAAGEDNYKYDEEYSISNMPKFFEVSEGHEVLATESQFKKWVH